MSASAYPLSTVPVTPRTVLGRQALLDGYGRLIAAADDPTDPSTSPLRLARLLLEQLLVYASLVNPNQWGPDGWAAPAFQRPITEVIPDLQICRLLQARGIETMADLIYWRYQDLMSVHGIGEKRAWYILWCQVAAGYRPPPLLESNAPHTIPDEFGGTHWHMIRYPPGRRPRFGENWRWVPASQIGRVPLVDLTYPPSGENPDEATQVTNEVCCWLAGHGIYRVEDVAGRDRSSLRSHLQSALKGSGGPNGPSAKLSADEIMDLIECVLPYGLALGATS